MNNKLSYFLCLCFLLGCNEIKDDVLVQQAQQEPKSQPQIWLPYKDRTTVESVDSILRKAEEQARVNRELLRKKQLPKRKAAWLITNDKNLCACPSLEQKDTVFYTFAND